MVASAIMASSTESSPKLPSSTTSTTLETLVSHLLASKRSLSSINHVWRANEIVTSTRKSLEKSAITAARIKFLRSGIDSQLKILVQVRANMESIAGEGAEELNTVIQSLDEADKRLTKTLELLRGTIVEASLKPEGKERRSLLDFVDESGVQGLLGTLKDSIKVASGAHGEFGESNLVFDEDVEAVKTVLGVSAKREVVDNLEDEDGGSPVPKILQDMEDHAKDMADNLESLVKHFDLCVTAIKHTEGGGDAAQYISDDVPDVVGIGQDAANAPSDPIAEEERREMMEILEKDAGQVEDVVMDIRDHISDMEVRHEQVETHMDRLAEEHVNTLSAFRLLEDIGIRLSGYISQKHVFLMRWDDEKAKIGERMEELEGLRDFYDGFLGAYDSLIIEIGRRKTLESKIEKVAQDAMTRIEKLYEDDGEEREAFRKEQGDFLPVDIWPGLMEGPLRYEILPVDGPAGRVPDISKSVIQQAIRRVSGKG